MKRNHTRFLPTLVILGALLLLIFFGSRILPVKLVDFSVYWSSGSLLLERGNPYDTAQMLAKEASLGFTGTNSSMLLYWYPPWTLPVAILAGIFPFEMGEMIWLIASVAIIVLCASLLWQQYLGNHKSRWVALLLAFTYTPLIFALLFGQVSPVMLLGLTAFLYFVQRDTPREDLLGGVCLGLAAIKPNALYLIWPVLLLWSITQRRYRALLGLALSCLISLVIALLFRPSILADYWQFVQTAQVTNWKVPTIGFWLKNMLGQSQVYIQYLPFTIGLAWLVAHWMVHRQKWSWLEQVSWLAFGSLITSAFVWTHDQVLLLPAVIEASILLQASLPAKSSRILVLIGWLAFNIVIFALHLSYDDSWFVWQAPLLLIGYSIVRYYCQYPSTKLAPTFDPK